MHCTHCGNKNDTDAQFCNYCGKSLIDEQQEAQSDLKQVDFVSPKSDFKNNSGQGKLAALPPQLYGWNWGAFFLSWIWGIGNSTMIAFLTWIPLVNFVMIFILGAKGNEWAWQNKRWKSIEHFKKVQKLWAVWGFILFVLGLLFMLLVIIAVMESY
jgi:zinc-ribbon domain